MDFWMIALILLIVGPPLFFFSAFCLFCYAGTSAMKLTSASARLASQRINAQAAALEEKSA